MTKTRKNNQIVTTPARPRRTLLREPALRTRVEQRYTEYRAARTAAAVMSRAADLTPEQRDALGACWGENEELGKLKDAILNSQPGDCPYCAVVPSDEWDHYLPKNDDDFPELSIFPDNLLPSCGRCNKLKKDKILKQGQRIFIHFYYDRFDPSECFLQVTFQFGKTGAATEDPPRAIFDLSPVASQSAFGKVFISHCTELGLLPLYNKLGRSYIRDVPSELRRTGREGPVENTASALEEMADAIVDQRGANHPRAVLYRAAARTPQFLAYCRRPSA